MLSFSGGRGFYTQRVDVALAEIERLPGRHLYFSTIISLATRASPGALRGHARDGSALAGSGHSAERAAPRPGGTAAAAGLRSLFVGFETLNPANLPRQHKVQNLNRDYTAAIRRLHDLGVMINGSFVFGMDDDDESVFERTVDWAVAQGIETATFHILTPYPGTALHTRMDAAGRMLHADLGPLRHTPRGLRAGAA